MLLFEAILRPCDRTWYLQTRFIKLKNWRPCTALSCRAAKVDITSVHPSHTHIKTMCNETNLSLCGTSVTRISSLRAEQLRIRILTEAEIYPSSTPPRSAVTLSRPPIQWRPLEPFFPRVVCGARNCPLTTI